MQQSFRSRRNRCAAVFCVPFPPIFMCRILLCIQKQFNMSLLSYMSYQHHVGLQPANLVTSIYNYEVYRWRCFYTGLRIILLISGGFVAYFFSHFFITGMLLLQAELYTRNKIMLLRADILYRTLYERMHKQCFTYRLAKSGRIS